MGILDGVSKFTIVSAILTAIAFLFQIIGFASPYWTKYDDNNHTGLWYGCILTRVLNFGTTISQCGTIQNKPGWFVATQAFETLGFLALLAALVMILVKCFVMKESRIPVIIRLALQIGAGGCILLGVIIYGSKQPSSDYYGFAFILCIIAAIVSLVSGVFTVLDLRAATTTR